MKRYQLGDIVSSIHSGGTPSTEKSEYWDGEHKWLSSGETSQDFIWNTVARITDEGIKQSSTKLAHRYDVVMACAGQGKTRGQVSFIMEDMYINQSVIAISANTDYILPLYLYYNLKNRYSELRGGSDASSIRGSITTAALKNLPVFLPVIHIQQNVVGLLFSLDMLIEKNNRKIAILHEQAHELYKEWFVRFRFPGHETTKFENGLPQGWKVKRIKDYGRIETGKTPSMKVPEYYGDELMFIKTPDMHGNTFVIETDEMLSTLGSDSQIKKLLPPNSIMVTCIGSGGIVAINAKQGLTNQQINSIVLNDLTNLEWLYFTCKGLKETIELFGATGATMTNLSKGKFEKLKIIDPGQNLITRYHELTYDSLKSIKLLMYLNRNLIKQRDLLLPRLMSGKLEV